MPTRKKRQKRKDIEDALAALRKNDLFRGSRGPRNEEILTRREDPLTKSSVSKKEAQRKIDEEKKKRLLRKSTPKKKNRVI